MKVGERGHVKFGKNLDTESKLNWEVDVKSTLVAKKLFVLRKYPIKPS